MNAQSFHSKDQQSSLSQRFQGTMISASMPNTSQYGSLNAIPYNSANPTNMVGGSSAILNDFETQQQYSGFLQSHSTMASFTDRSNISGFSTSSAIEHLDLSTFKVEPCPLSEKHETRKCPYYHNQKDRRRKGAQYSSEMCSNSDRCPSGDSCTKAHNQVEVNYSKEQYKKKYCQFFPHQISKCDYGSFCSYAHSDNDILIELLHLMTPYDNDFFMFYYKTVFCPYKQKEEGHQRDRCVYAHNKQDFRRRPDLYSYEPVTCTNWPSKEIVANYESGCPQGYDCSKCHGWKELDYHPRIYKTKSCSVQNNSNQSQCKKPFDCPHYHHHTANDQRQIPQQVQSKVFRLVPATNLNKRIPHNAPQLSWLSSNSFNASSQIQMSQFLSSQQQFDQQAPYNQQQQLRIQQQHQSNNQNHNNHSNIYSNFSSSILQPQQISQQSHQQHFQSAQRDNFIAPPNQNGGSVFLDGRQSNHQTLAQQSAYEQHNIGMTTPVHHNHVQVQGIPKIGNQNTNGNSQFLFGTNQQQQIHKQQQMNNNNNFRQSNFQVFGNKERSNSIENFSSAHGTSQILTSNSTVFDNNGSSTFHLNPIREVYQNSNSSAATSQQDFPSFNSSARWLGDNTAQADSDDQSNPSERKLTSQNSFQTSSLLDPNNWMNSNSYQSNNKINTPSPTPNSNSASQQVQLNHSSFDPVDLDEHNSMNLMDIFSGPTPQKVVPNKLKLQKKPTAIKKYKDESTKFGNSLDEVIPNGQQQSDKNANSTIIKHKPIVSRAEYAEEKDINNYSGSNGVSNQEAIVMTNFLLDDERNHASEDSSTIIPSEQK